MSCASRVARRRYELAPLHSTNNLVFFAPLPDLSSETHDSFFSIQPTYRHVFVYTWMRPTLGEMVLLSLGSTKCFNPSPGNSNKTEYVVWLWKTARLPCGGGLFCGMLLIVGRRNLLGCAL